MAKLYLRSLKTTLLGLLLTALPAAAAGFDIPADLGSYAVLSCKDLKIAGNSVVSSEALGGAAQGEQGHVRSNGDVVLDGSIEVHGDAVAGPGKQVRISGQPLVTGQKRVATLPFVCAPVDLVALRVTLLAQNDNSRIPLTLKGKPALGGPNGRTLDLNGKDELTLPAGTYLFDEIRLAGNARVRVSGDVRILVTGAIDIKGGSHIHLDGNPYQVRLWSLGTTVSIASQSNVHAFLYAPAAALTLAGQSRIVGGVQADRVEIVGGSRVRRVIDDAKLGLTLTSPQEGQSVSVCAIPVTGTVLHVELLAQLTVNGVPVTPSADGSFSTTASLATPDPGLVEIVATDRSGNTVRVAVRVVIVPPALALTAPAEPLVGNRIVNLAGTSGTATEVTVNGIAAQVANGAFRLDGFDLGAEDGLVDLVVVGRNCGGEVSETFVLDLDTKAPVVAIDSPVQGDLFGSSPITVTGTVEDAHLTSVTVNGVTAAIEGQRFTAEGVVLSEGNNNLVAVATDALGRTATSTVTVQLDTTAPTVTITEPENGAVVSVPQIVVRGTVSDTNLHEVKVNGVLATVTGTSFEATITLAEGENFLVATARDAAGNPAESPRVTVVLDTLPPVITLATLPELTAHTPITVRGTVSDPHLDKVTVNGIEASVVGEEFVAEIPLQEGANAIVARAVDTVGHSAETAPLGVTLDTLAPQVTITEPQAGAQLTSRTVTVRGTVVDPHLDKVFVMGIEATVAGNTFEATVELPEGDSSLVARATDILDHAADSEAVPVAVDTLAPMVRLDSPQDPLVSTPTVRVTGKAEDPHLAEVQVKDLPATVDAEGLFVVEDVPLVEGPNEIRATARDSFGNEAVSEPVLYVLDTTAPAVAITSPVDGQVMTSLEALVTGTFSDPHLLGVTVNGIEATLDEAAGTFSVSVPLTDGANTLTAVATDRAGHTAQAAVTVVLDTQPPTVTLDQPVLPAGACLPAGTPQILGGAFVDANPAAAPVTVEVVDASGAKRTYPGTLSGTRWTASGVDLGATDGLTTVLVIAADALGNTSRVSASFRIDAAAPVVRLTLDGASFPNGALFGRAIAAGVRVEDGSASSPPAATLTLDGAPYAAGTLITAEGPHVLVATATDCAGHTTTMQAQFTIDLTPPVLRSTSPAADARVTTSVASFSGVSDPDLAKATINGQPAVVSNGAFTLSPFLGREGRNEVSIALEDRAGNRASYQVAFTVRTVALSVEIREGGGPIPANAAFLRPVRPDVRASDSTATVTATLNGAPFVSGTEIAQSGTYHLIANATDDWGRTAHTEARFSIDLGAPPQIAITSPADGAVVPGLTVRVEGTVSGDAPTVTVNGVAATVTGGTWMVASLPLEADATTEIVATTRDRFGRAATAGVTVRVVSGGPQILILEPADGTVTNRSVIDVVGAVVGGRNRSANGTVTIQGQAIELAPDGTFRALDVPLQSGANTLTATVTDSESRTGSASVQVTADFTPPTLRFFVRANGPEEPLADGASFGRPVTLIVEATDDSELDAPPSIRLNGAVQAGATVPRTEISLAASGGYVVSANVEDAAGNEARAERSFVLDFGGCSLADVSPASGSAVASATVSLVGRATGAASVKVRVPQPGGGTQEYTASLAEGTFLAGDVPLPAVGENALELVCVDAIGGVQSTPHVVERLAADAGPVIDITAPAAGAVLGSDSVTVSGTVTNGAVTVNGLSAVVTPGTPLDSFSAANVSLSEGPNPLLARAVDAAGRSAEDRIVVQRDTQAPRVQVTRPDNHAKVGVPGAGPATIDVSGLVDLDAEPNLASVVVASSKGSVTATVDPQTGVFLAQGVPLDAAAGAEVEQTLTVSATDTLGHAGTASVAVALDPAGPALVLSEPADLTRFRAGASGPITVRGQAWAAPGTSISVNGIDLDPATLPWEAAGPDGRRRVAFTATVSLPSTDGPFGIIARATDLQGRIAQDRRLLYRDTQALRVVEMVPADGATGVDANGLLLVLFSESVLHSSLDVADGLRLTRVATGQDVVGSKAVAGQAVGFVPGAALAAGESYVLRAGTGITDVAGNALATPAEVRFTVAASSTGGAPVLEPLPAVLCTDEIQVKGTAAPGATLKVRDGDLTFTGFADTAGAFTVSVPVTGSGYHLLTVWALDAASGARSPEATAVVRVDCRAPSVTEARFDRETGTIRIVFSEAVAPATLAVGGAEAAIRLLDAEVPGVYQTGTLSLPGANEAQVQLDASASAWWRDRPVRLQVAPPAADLEGNAMAAVYERVFFPGGSDLSGGFLFGEVYDDTTGRPLAGVPVSLFASGQASAVAGAVTDGRGRFVLAGEVPAGRYVLVSGSENTTRVYRRLSLRPSAGVVPFDSRVTPLAEPAGSLEPAAGGSVTSGNLTFAAVAAALPGASPVAVLLTPLSGQGLPDFLPLGWTPVAAAEVRLEQDGTMLTDLSGTASLELPVASAAGLAAARYEPATGRWLALPDPEPVAAGRVRVSLDGPGTIAVVMPDSASSPSAGEPLVGVERPEQTPALVADLTLDPPVVAPTGRARARVVARSADSATAWPSGLAVQAFLEERLVLTGGGEELEAPFSADLVLYHPALTPAEQGGAATGAAGAMEFMVSPSPRAAQVLLEVGWENIRLFPFPEEVERGPLVGPDGGTIDSPEGVELSIPEGALTAKVPVSATLLSTSELAALPAVAGYDTLAAVRIELSGATLARPATLALPKPSGTPADSQTEPRVILAELIDAPVDGRGTLARMVARTRQDGERVVAAPELAGLLPLDGIVREGLYLLLAAQQPLGFSTGFVRAGNEIPVAHSRVTADGLGTGDLSRLTGRYAVPVPAGASRRLVARHPSLDERGEGTIPSLSPGQIVTLDLTVSSVPPRVVSVTPTDGATNQPLASAVSVLFSEALDPATVTSSTLTLELAGPDGGATGIFIDGKVILSEGVRVVFAPSRPLLPGRAFRALFTGGVADAGGAIYAGSPVLWTFSTSTAIVPGGQVHPEKFHLRLPVNGVAEIYGEPGALPGSLPGQTPWVVTPEIEGPVADPQRDTFQGRTDGSFTGTVGHPPGFAVTLGSRIWVKVFDPTGTLAAQFRVGPFTTPDGLGFVAPAGEAVTFRSAEGLVVDVPAGAFSKPTLVRVRTLQPSALGLAVPHGLGLGAFVDVDFEGEAKETLRLSVPAPANAADGAQVFIGQPVNLPWGRRLQVLSVGGVMERDGQRYLSNDPSLQPEPEIGALTGASRSGMRLVAGSAKRTCQKARQEGLPQCFLQSLMMEFTLRSQAAFMYELGVDFTLLTGFAQPFPMMMGIAYEAIFNKLADMWVYLPVPHDWNGGFVLPVISTEPLELVRRDTATGWVLASQTYDPVGGGQDLISVGFLGSGQAVRPLLIDARPFQLYRLAAPQPEDTARLSLEMEMETDNTGAVTVASMPGFKMPAGTTVTVYDLSPTTPEPAEDGEPEPEPAAPIAGPTVNVCNPDTAWSTSAMNGSDDMLVVVSPGGLDAASLDQIELQFDQPLEDITGKPVDEVAKLLDLGPLDEEGCGSATEAGYPRKVALALDQLDRRSRLVILPLSALPAGHRFRLEIVPSAITVDDPEGSSLAYWETAPTRFEFATREVPGEPISELPGDAFGTSNVARDMLKLGNLLLVASESGDLLAVDVSRASEEEGLERYAVKNKGAQTATRALATDGHNRIFYAGLFGMTWGIKAMRLEDVRDADAECVSPPSWATGLPCFEGVEGSVRVSYALGSISGTTASEWLALGTMPEATPMKMAVLAQDEKGRTLELADFADAYTINLGTPDAEGIHTFNISLKSTLTRSEDGELEPSLVPGTVPEPAVAEWRKKVCDGEEDYDRYQRVTIDNLTTGQAWSIDVENPWPNGGAGSGAVVSGVRARKGDQLRVRYNLRTLGHVALLGSGITVVDLNRFYRLLQPYQTPGSGQCGRRLGKFEGQQLEFPSCAPASIDMEGIRMTAAVVTHGKTGCDTGNCRGAGFIDIYSPLTRVGALHTRSTETAPGGVENGLFGTVEGPEALQFSDLAACIQNVNGQNVMLRDVALANDVQWIYRGIHGDISGAFQDPPESAEPLRLRGDLLFVTLGSPGVFVFDVSSRSLLFSGLGGPSLVGHLSVPDHSAFRLQVDPVRNLLFAGGTDAKTGKPVIDVWDISSINGGPDLDARPTPIATLNAPWSTNQLGIDGAGTGLVYTWGAEDGPLAVPFDRAQFVFSGLYRAEDEEDDRPISGVQRPTSRFVPLGAPMETSLEEEKDNRKENEKLGTASFKVRVALPGSLGPELTAKVQSLRALPGDESLGQEDVGPSVALPGGPGWPENEVVVHLRRVGLGSDEGAAGLEGESGPLGTAYQLYESVETVLLLADPRARGDYHRQDAPSDEKHDEEAQCRRCTWPDYLPDPEGNDPALDDIKELLAGRYVRAFLFASDESENATKIATEKAIEFFEARGRNYPLPAGWAEVAGPADAVPSPLQASQAEPAQGGARWDAGEAGVSVAVPGGELLLTATDHSVQGRALPFRLDRTYRSGMLGYGSLGSAGWSGSLFAHLRELPVTGEVEYHDGLGQVWRFLPRTAFEAPEGYDDDEAGSYYVPEGLYLRLQKLSGGQGWRLIGREHDVALFDGDGRLVELSDRLYRGGTNGDQQGNRMQLRYDAFGQLMTVVDDLARRYSFEYYDDPRPEPDGDGDRYGLLKSVTDFMGREVELEFDGDRRLTRVRLPEVENPVDAYSSFSYTGDSRPTLEYRYNAEPPVSSSEEATGVLLHGEFAKLRLSDFRLPDFVEGASGVPRARFTYEPDSGRIASVGFPTPDNVNSSTSSVKWSFDWPDAFPPDRFTLRAPWGHDIEHTLVKGRITERREPLQVHRPGHDPMEEMLSTTYTYAEDGRLTSTQQPNGLRVSQCFADGQGGAGCSSGGGSATDLLMKANVVSTIQAATTPAAKGSADYTEIVSGASYQEDNQLSSVTDGEGRPIDMAVAMPGQQSTTRFGAENVSATFTFDRFGRVTRSTGGGTDSPEMRVEYGEDAEGRKGAGLVERVERGGAFWQEFFYDDAYNIERVETSQGTATETDYDTWDRPVRTVAGLSLDGRFAPVGFAECTLGEGVRGEKAFDAAGHVVRERKLQDYVDPVDGATKCRWVETRYVYNAREQLVSIDQTHLASANNPGQVIADAQTVAINEFDPHGRLERERSKAVSRPDLVTTYAYDTAGRVASTQTGDEGVRRLGYDEGSRVVFRTDGHEGIWRGRFDAWGRLYHEEPATGAVIRRRFDRANNPLEETVFDADPLTTPTAQVLSDVKTEINSFGAVERIAEALTAPEGSAPAEIRVTENVFDGSGRVIEVWSGPPNPEDATRVDLSRARRDKKIEYEPTVGRVLVERFGGDGGTAPLHGVSYVYLPESDAPWPDAVTFLESVPGQPDLVPTSTAAYRRDVFGRPVEERHSDGTVLSTVYDRSGDAIRARTGAGAEISRSFDSRGLPVKVVRPNGRGFTLYAYDVDGALLREATRSATAELWETAYGYDITGRASSITYADGTSETLTYNPDSTVKTMQTRDGLLLAYGYDAANRLLTVTPTLAGGAVPTLLDAGDSFSWDDLARPTLLERGRPGAASYDPALAVRYPAYDLASRPGSEVVGSRGPLSWKYDTWNRPSQMTLPAGPGRSASGPFQGFTRSFDTLDRLEEVSGLGATGLSSTPMGARWDWGGAGRLYGMTTKGALQTAARYGYHGGAGPQIPGYDAGLSVKWKLGTMIWGSAGAASATAAPQNPWGGFGFGWRGNEGDPADGAKIGRKVLPLPAGSPDLFSGMGWAFGYDGGVRLSYAAAGEGDLEGEGSPSDTETFRFGYGAGDELARIVREATGQIAELQTGDYGRILSRNGAPFSYDGVGRRLEDDRFVYQWDWRGQLVSVTVKNAWPDADGDGEPEATPWAGHQVRYDYDAAGRMTHRWHTGKLPEGETDDAQRPFLEKRVFVWEGDGLAAEAAYGNAEETIFRWRKTYVPGPSGLDDAVQVIVEDASGTARTYTLLRDEMGTVVGVVAEDEGTDPAKPTVPARYRYTPYGEVHAETGPELMRARFDADSKTVASAGGLVTQSVVNANTAAAGAIALDWTLPLDSATLPSNLVVERLQLGLGWLALEPDQIAIGTEPEDGISSGGGGPPRLLVMAKDGWQRGSSYRVRLKPTLADELGRGFGRTESLEWRVPEAAADGSLPAVLFDRKIAIRFESSEAAKDDVAGRFPGGQTSLFQGLWTDPVTGAAYARARWYDARNAAWLSEDPLADIDSPNLYAFTAWQPTMGIDPFGTDCLGIEGVLTCGDIADSFLSVDAAKRSGQFLLGEIDGAVDAAKGIVNAVLHPIDTAEAVITGVVTLTERYGNDPSLIMSDIEASIDGYINASPREQGKPVGAFLFDIASGAVAAKAATGVRGLARWGDDLADAGRGQRALEKLDDFANCPVIFNCFTAGTLVATPQGLVPIETIEAGDQVFAYDEATGEERLSEVVAVYRRDVEALWVLEVGGERIETTDEHPFYVAGKGWTEAKNLQVGDVLIAAGGDRWPIESVEQVQQIARVYNFEVRDLHSYFVGTVGAVVHNCGAKRNSWNEFQKGTAGKYGTRREAADAYHTLKKTQDPWPAGATPTDEVLTPGTRFKMALEPGQALDSPGRWGTFDDIPDVAYARDDLAITKGFKSEIDRVVEFEVTNDLPVRTGPVGPQVDLKTGQFRPGGGTQIQLMVVDRMKYLRVVGFRWIR